VGGCGLRPSDWGGLFDTLGLGSTFPLYISLIFLGYSLLDLTGFDWADISVD